MSALSLPGPVFQYAWIVPDLDEAIKYWSEVVGVGPFFTTEFDSATIPDFTYRGEPATLRQRIGWAQGHEGQIELLQPTTPAPNIYFDLIPKGQIGFHHVGIWSDDFDADKEKLLGQGYEIASSLTSGETRIAYFDTSGPASSMLELIERKESIVGLFELIRAAAKDWDGSKPARTMDELMG